MKKAVTYSIMGDQNYHILAAISIHSLIDSCKNLDMDIIVFLADMNYVSLFKHFPEQVRFEPMPELPCPPPEYQSLEFIKKHVDFNNCTIFSADTVDTEYPLFMNGYYRSCDAQILGAMRKIKDYNRIICLDIDTIVQRDINELFAFKKVSYFPDGEKIFMGRIYVNDFYTSEANVNAGVVVIDCDMYRHFEALGDTYHIDDWYRDLDKSEEKAQLNHRHLNTINWGECYLTNCLFRWKLWSLPRIWNNFPVEGEDYSKLSPIQRKRFRDYISESNIIHYMASNKPWFYCPPDSTDARALEKHMLPVKNWVRVYLRHKNKYPELANHIQNSIKLNMILEAYLDKGIDLTEIKL